MKAYSRTIINYKKIFIIYLFIYFCVPDILGDLKEVQSMQFV